MYYILSAFDPDTQQQTEIKVKSHVLPTADSAVRFTLGGTMRQGDVLSVIIPAAEAGAVGIDLPIVYVGRVHAR